MNWTVEILADADGCLCCIHFPLSPGFVEPQDHYDFSPKPDVTPLESVWLSAWLTGHTDGFAFLNRHCGEAVLRHFTKREAK